MKDFCLRKKLEGNCQFDLSSPFFQSITLLGCHVCNHLNDISKYEKLLIFPLLLSQKEENSRFYRTFGSVILDNLGDEFSDDALSEKDFEVFLHNLSDVARRKITLKDVVSALSPSKYCHIMARLYWSADYGVMYGIAIAFFSYRTKRYYQGSRINLSYIDHENNQVFQIFQIGVSLDEGVTEELTVNVMRTMDVNYESDAYFFERKFLHKIMTVLNYEIADFVKLAFSSDKSELYLLFDKNKHGDLCNVYNLLYLSDNQKWKEANEVLKKWNRSH